MNEEWVVREVVLEKSGNNYGKKWSMKVIVNPYGLHFARVQVDTDVEFWGLYEKQEHAEQVGYQKLADMMPAVVEG